MSRGSAVSNSTKNALSPKLFLSVYVEINQLLINQQIKMQFLNCEWFNCITDLH